MFTPKLNLASYLLTIPNMTYATLTFGPHKNTKMPNKDAHLIEEAQKNNPSFDALYEKYKDKIMNYFLYRVGRNYDNAEELTQETFLKAFKALNRFVIQDCSYLTYLLKIAHNLLVNHYRGNKLVLRESVEDDRITTMDDVETKLEMEKVWSEVAKELTTAEERALRLRYQNDLAVKDIASDMNRTSNAVKLLLCHGRKKLKYLKPQLF
jgi:RNA polymerase sigma-70 factor (ECF subfamily)